MYAKASRKKVQVFFSTNLSSPSVKARDQPITSSEARDLMYPDQPTTSSEARGLRGLDQLTTSR